MKGINCYFTKVDVVMKFRDSMMFNFLNNLLNISMIFKEVLFDDFDMMLLSSLKKWLNDFKIIKLLVRHAIILKLQHLD